MHSARIAEERALSGALANQAMARYARGDDSAFEPLYALLGPRLYTLCIRLIGHAEAEELLQEVLLRMHRARATFMPDGSVITWSFAIAHNSCIDRMRRTRRCPEDLMEPEHLEVHAAPRACCPESATTAQELHQLLEVGLLALSEPVRSAYVLVKLEGLSCAEASVRLDTSVVAIKQRVHRASEQLKLGMLRGGW